MRLLFLSGLDAFCILMRKGLKFVILISFCRMVLGIASLLSAASRCLCFLQMNSSHKIELMKSFYLIKIAAPRRCYLATWWDESGDPGRTETVANALRISSEEKATELVDELRKQYPSRYFAWIRAVETEGGAIGLSYGHPVEPTDLPSQDPAQLSLLDAIADTEKPEQ